MNSRWIAGLVIGLAACFSAQARVVINEIYYHGPGDLDRLEYVEIHNAGDQQVSLSGWKFTKGIKVTFTEGTILPAHGYVVVTKDRAVLQRYFKTEAAATFEQALKNSGERIELVNERGEVIDSVRFHSKRPWPAGPNGYSPSLERINPDAPSELPENWTSSAMPAGAQKPTGTPGKQNSRFSSNLPPIISNVKWTPSSPAPDQTITVEADVQDTDGVREVKLLYRLTGTGTEGSETSVPMMKDATGNRYTGTIPGQKMNQLVRFRVQAEDQQNTKRTFPDEQEPRPALSVFMFDKREQGQIALGHIIHVDASEAKSAQRQQSGRGVSEEDQMRMTAWQQFRTGIDLPGAWTELVLNQPLAFESARKLQTIFAQKRADLEALIDQTIQAPNLAERAREVPKLITKFSSDLAMEVKSALTEEQVKPFTRWQQAQRTANTVGPDRILKQVVPLERGFFASTVQATVTEAQYEKLKAIYQPAREQRAKLTDAVAAAMKGQGDRNKLLQELQSIWQKTMKDGSGVLTAEQQQQFSALLAETPPPMSNSSADGSEPARGKSAFVFIDPKTSEAHVYDFITIRPRNAGFKIHFHDDQPLNGMTGINLIFEYKDRFVIAEHLAYELYHRANCPAPLSDYVRLTVDGRPLGYQLLVEQPNRGFIERNKIAAGGDLYKLLWYGNDLVSKHEKKNNPETGHTALLKLIGQLERTSGDAQWQVIRTNFNVERVINYFAVNTCLTHWDGFFNNYFTYHDTHATGKWEIYPWDQDKTWGFHDGLGDEQFFWDMPIRFGMTGAETPNGGATGFQGFNAGSYWRPPGAFSGPLLANPQFRKHFLARTKEILETTFTPEVFNPIIDDVGKHLKDEVAIRAKAIGENPAVASRRLTTNLQMFKDQLVKRREFLLKEAEIRSAGKFEPAAVN